MEGWIPLVSVRDQTGWGSERVNGVWMPAGDYRRGYHMSHLVHPGLRPTPAGKAALARFSATHPAEPVVWRREGAYDWWLTLTEHNRRLRILAWCRKRERGIRTTLRALADRMDVPYTSLQRTLRALARSGAIRLTVTRGRNGRTRIEMIRPTEDEPMNDRIISDGMSDATVTVKSDERGSGDFWERIRAQARARFEEINRDTPW
jgi:hypothetical protein